METEKVKAFKLHPDFFCIKTGVCDRIYICINPRELFNPVCPHLLVRSPSRGLYEDINIVEKKV